MVFSRPLIVAAFAGLSLSLFACARASTGGGGGSGGEEDWTTAGPTGSSSGTGSTGSGGGGATFCDTKSADCTACIDCSRGTADGLCQAVYNDCLNEVDCTDYSTCLNACAQGDTLCQMNCDSVHSLGSSLFGTYASCVICQDCYVLCDGATSCKTP